MKIFKNIKWLVLFFILAFIAFGLWLCKDLFINSDGPIYGNRTDFIKDIEFTEPQKTELNEFLKSQAGVVNAKTVEHGIIINVIIYVESDITIAEAKKIAESSLEKFPEDILKNYDLGFLIDTESDEETKVFPINGSKNKKSLEIIW